MAAARQIADDILADKDSAQERYLAFLAPVARLPGRAYKNVGVDMNQSAPVDNLLAYFSGLVDELTGYSKRTKGIKYLYLESSMLPRHKLGIIVILALLCPVFVIPSGCSADKTSL